MMVAPPQPQDFPLPLKPRRDAGTPSKSSVDATFPLTGALHNPLPTDGALPPAVALHQQLVADIGQFSKAEPLQLRATVKAQSKSPNDEARSEAGGEDEMCIKKRKLYVVSGGEARHHHSASGTRVESPAAGPSQPRRSQRLSANKNKILGLSDEENPEPCSCPLTKHIDDSLRLAGENEYLKQNILLRQHFYGIGHRTAYNKLIFCEPPRPLITMADIDGLERAPDALPRIECQLDPTVPKNRRLWKIDRLVDFIDLKADGTQRFVLVNWLPTGKGARKESDKQSWVHWEQIMDSTFALEFLVRWEREHLIPEVLRRAKAIKEGRPQEATSDALGRFYRLNRWTNDQVFGSCDAVQDEIAFLRQQLGESEKRNEELDEELQRKRQECLALRAENARLKEIIVVEKVSIPVGNRSKVLTHLKTVNPLTAQETPLKVTFADTRTTGQVFRIRGVEIVVANLFFRQHRQKPRLYKSSAPQWNKVDKRIDGFTNQLEGYNPYESAFRSITVTWNDEDSGLLEFCLLVGIAQRHILGLGARHEQEAARTSTATNFFGKIVASQKAAQRERFYKQLKSSVFLKWFYNEAFMQQEKKDLDFEEWQALEQEAFTGASRHDLPSNTS